VAYFLPRITSVLTYSASRNMNRASVNCGSNRHTTAMAGQARAIFSRQGENFDCLIGKVEHATAPQHATPQN